MSHPDNPLSVLQISSADIAGGAAKVAWNLFQGCRQHGHRAWLAVGRKNGIEPDVVEIPNDEYRNSWARFWRKIAFRADELDGGARGAWCMHRLLRWLAEPKRVTARAMGIEDFVFPGTWHILDLFPELPDIIHCHNLHGGYFDLRALPWLSRQVPVILTLHDAWLLSGHCAHSFDCEQWKTGCGDCPYLTVHPAIKYDRTSYNWQRKRGIYAKSRFYISTPSYWLMEKVKQSILASAIVESKIIPNGVDLAVFHPGDKKLARASLNLPLDSKIVLFAANRIQRNSFKDYATMKIAVERVMSRNRNTKLIFVCLGVKEKESSLNQSHVRFVSFEPNPQRVAQYYQAADFYIHAAKAETFPTAVTEALACGTPVVATAVGGIPEQVENGINGFLVPSGDAEAMAVRIEQLLLDVDLRRKFSLAAAETARRRFDLNQHVNDYIKWYSEILERSYKHVDSCRKNPCLKKII